MMTQRTQTMRITDPALLPYFRLVIGCMKKYCHIFTKKKCFGLKWTAPILVFYVLFATAKACSGRFLLLKTKLSSVLRIDYTGRFVTCHISDYEG
jgi:hypothetical protein